MMLAFKVNSATFYTDSFPRRVNTAAGRVGKKFGAYVRTPARRLIRKARMKRLGEMTEDEREKFELQKKIAAETGGPKPKRPQATAGKGEPPRWHTQQNPLKKLTVFAWEPGTSSVVIGPALRQTAENKGLLSHLEEGGSATISVRVYDKKKRRSRKQSKVARFQGNPWLGPTFREQLNQHMPAMWRDALN